jgi:carboxymethylenebutenolidase
MTEIALETRDGVCPSFVYHPEGQGPWPAILLYMDGPGIRPAVHDVAKRLAGYGYLVLLPDLFYRSGPYAPIDPKVVFTNPELRDQHRQKFMAVTTPERIMSDTGYFLDYLDGRADVKPSPIGVTGYCMGGRFALLAAASFPDRIAVAASYHGGGLVSDAPSSPHRQAGKIKAKVYVAGAIEDGNFTDEQKQTLIEALSKAGVDHKVETYPAKHGWVLSDMPVYDEACAERHWDTLVPLMDGVLRKGD